MLVEVYRVTLIVVPLVLAFNKLMVTPETAVVSVLLSPVMVSPLRSTDEDAADCWDVQLLAFELAEDGRKLNPSHPAVPVMLIVLLAPLSSAEMTKCLLVPSLITLAETAAFESLIAAAISDSDAPSFTETSTLSPDPTWMLSLPVPEPLGIARALSDLRTCSALASVMLLRV